MEKDLLNIVKSRRSTRQFSDGPVSDETIQKILDMAAYAPSSWGGHPVEYIVVRDKTTMAKLAGCKQMGAGPLAYGAAAIVPIIDKRNV